MIGTTQNNNYIEGQVGVLRGLPLKIKFLEFLDIRERQLPAGFTALKNIVSSQSYKQ